MLDIDEDVVRELREKKPTSRCVCGDDLPGTCPGVTNCPFSGEGEEDESETAPQR